MLAQQNSKDAIHAVLGVNRTQPTPSALVEESLVSLGLLAMELSEVGTVGGHYAGGLILTHTPVCVGVCRGRGRTCV